jgi:hypothetical protein
MPGSEAWILYPIALIDGIKTPPAFCPAEIQAWVRRDERPCDLRKSRADSRDLRIFKVSPKERPCGSG